MKVIGPTRLGYLWGNIKSYIAGKKYAGGAADGGTANKAASIPFGEVDSTSTANAFTATVDGITELRSGVCCYLINDVVTSAAASTAPKCWTLNINNLGAKPVYVTNAAASYATNLFVKNYKMLFTYDTSLDSGNGGWYIGQLYNTNTTYSEMTQAEIDAGTGTTGRRITPKMLRDNFYTEDEVDALLGSKANSNDLATVATSGSYNDLDDTPAIPSVILSNNYSTSTDTNEDLLLESGDTFEEAFGKLEKAILDNEDVYAAAFNDLNGRLQEKEKCITTSGYSKTTDFTANVGLYYSVSIAASTSITITLATPNDNTKLSSCIFFVTTSTSPTLIFAAANGVSIYKSKDFAIEEGTYYEVNALWNGTSWYIAQMELEVQS